MNARRLSWIIQFAAMAAASLLYPLLTLFPGFPVAAAGSAPGLRTALTVLGSLAVLAGAVFAQTRLPEPPEGGLAPAERDALALRFQQRSTVAMALAEMGAVAGFVLRMVCGVPLSDAAALSAGSLLALVLVILPRGLRFLSAFEPD